MKISELIEELQEVQESCGDLIVCVTTHTADGNGVTWATDVDRISSDGECAVYLELTEKLTGVIER